MEISTAISPGTIAHSGGRKMAGKSEKTEGSADFAGLLALGMTARQSVGAATAPADAPLGESLAASPLPATGKPGGKQALSTCVYPWAQHLLQERHV